MSVRATAIKNEEIVVKSLEKEYGWKGWMSPYSERIDFTLGNENFVNVVGEIKTREKYFSEGWFVGKKKIKSLLDWKKVLVNASPWFCIYCTKDNFIYILDVADEFKRSSYDLPDEDGWIVPISEWKRIPSITD
jgi:hypothetical protein